MRDELGNWTVTLLGISPLQLVAKLCGIISIFFCDLILNLSLDF